MERQFVIFKILRTWEKATVALWYCALLKKNLIHVVNYKDFFFSLFLPRQFCAEGILAEWCHNGHPAIPLLNELLLTQIGFRITGHRCLGVWGREGVAWKWLSVFIFISAFKPVETAAFLSLQTLFSHVNCDSFWKITGISLPGVHLSSCC